MTDSTFKRFVEVGRVVLLKSGPSAGKIAVISEIIDHNRGNHRWPDHRRAASTLPLPPPLSYPSSSNKASSRRKVWCYSETDRQGGVVAKWESSSWARKRAAVQKRRSLNDFERFSVMIAKKQRRDVVRKSLAKAAKA